MLSLKSFIEKMSESTLVESNKFKDKEHETQFANILKESGFEKVDAKSDFGIEIKSHDSLVFVSEYRNKFLFIDQPFGSQKTPDFIVVIDGWVLYVELKRNKGKKITWNTGYPRNNYLYIYDSGKLGRIMFFGDHHLEYGEMDDDYLSNLTKWKKMSKEMWDKTSFDFYPRQMLNDRGEYDKDDLYIKALDKINMIISNEV